MITQSCNEMDNKSTTAPEPENNKKNTLSDLLAQCRAETPLEAEDTETIITTIRVCKPDKRKFIRVHRTLRFDGFIYEALDRNIYLVTKSILPLFPPSTVRWVSLRLYTTTDGQYFFWPLKEQTNEWGKSAWKAAKLAEDQWIRVASKGEGMGGSYQVHVPKITEFSRNAAPIKEPEWPSETLGELLEAAFEGKFIDRPDHPELVYLQSGVREGAE